MRGPDSETHENRASARDGRAEDLGSLCLYCNSETVRVQRAADNRGREGGESAWWIESKPGPFRLAEGTGAPGEEAPRGRTGVGMGPLIRAWLCLPRSECPSIVFAWSLSISRVV